MLDKQGVIAASVLGFIVGGLGHWTWLIILLGFLLSSHKATKWRFEDKRRWAYANQKMDIEDGKMLSQTVSFRALCV